MFGRIVATGAVVLLVSAGATWADEVGGGPIVVPPTAMVEEVIVVEAAPPPFAIFETTAIGAGVGFTWGSGTLSFDGEKHGFGVKGVSLGDIGMAKLAGEGDVHGLDRVDQFAGTYVAVGAGAAAGAGGSAITMRNEHGVTLTVRSSAEGARLNVGPQSLTIALD